MALRRFAQESHLNAEVLRGVMDRLNHRPYIHNKVAECVGEYEVSRDTLNNAEDIDLAPQARASNTVGVLHLPIADGPSRTSNEVRQDIEALEPLIEEVTREHPKLLLAALLVELQAERKHLEAVETAGRMNKIILQ